MVTDSLTWADLDATAAYVQGHGAAAWLATRPRRTGFVEWADGTTTTVSGPDGGPALSHPSATLTR